MRNPRSDPLTADIPGEEPRAPERRCVLSGVHGSREALVRLALSPEGAVLPDALARAPGRGAWIAVDRATLEASVVNGKLRGALARAFKGAALSVPPDLAAMVEVALTRALTDRLGLELRAGKVLLGSDRIAENARSGRVAWLGHAADAGEDGSRKLDQALRVGREEEGSGARGTRLPLDRAALSVALGRDNVVHLALSEPAAAERVAAPLQRLLHFLGRGAEEEETADRPGRFAAADADDAIDTKDATVR